MRYYIEIDFDEELTEMIRLHYKGMSWNIPTSAWKDGEATVSLKIDKEADHD